MEKLAFKSFRFYLHKLFPNLYKAKVDTEEYHMRTTKSEVSEAIVETPYITWEVGKSECDYVVYVRHFYTRKDTIIGIVEEEVSVPYLYAHAEPIEIRPVSGSKVDLKSIEGMPVFQLKRQMYDVSKIYYLDYMSMLPMTGRILEKAKTQFEINEEFDKWLKGLQEKSDDIMANARC